MVFPWFYVGWWLQSLSKIVRKTMPFFKRILWCRPWRQQAIIHLSDMQLPVQVLLASYYLIFQFYNETNISHNLCFWYEASLENRSLNCYNHHLRLLCKRFDVVQYVSCTTSYLLMHIYCIFRRRKCAKNLCKSVFR